LFNLSMIIKRITCMKGNRIEHTMEKFSTIVQSHVDLFFAGLPGCVKQPWPGLTAVVPHGDGTDDNHGPGNQPGTGSDQAAQPLSARGQSKYD